MAYNHGKEERKWRIWKEAEEKILRNCGVPECIIEQIRTYDRADFNSNRRFYLRLNDVGEYIEETEAAERQTEVKTVSDLLNEIENVNLTEIERRTGIRRGRLRTLKANGFIVKPHGLTGKPLNNGGVIEEFTGIVNELLSKGITNAAVGSKDGSS